MQHLGYLSCGDLGYFSGCPSLIVPQLMPTIPTASKCTKGGSYDSVTARCQCAPGDILDNRGYCNPGVDVCPNEHANSRYISEVTSCSCNIGYIWDDANTDCIKSPQISPKKKRWGTSYCLENSTLISGSCKCDVGFVYSHGRCISNTEDCRNAGPNLYGRVSDYNPETSRCECVPGYKWNDDKKKGCTAIDSLENVPTQYVPVQATKPDSWAKRLFKWF